MKIITGFVLVAITVVACVGKKVENGSKPSPLPIAGTWKLITGTVIEKGDTVVTDYTKNISFIKIINESYFAFLQHDINKGKGPDATFVSGGGKYSLSDSVYTEYLEYCSARDWEGNDFIFTVNIKNDTLIQSGIEKVETAGISRLNIEKYTRVKE